MKKTFIYLCLIIAFTNCKNNNEDLFLKTFNHAKTIKLSSHPVILKKSDVFFSHLFELKYVDDLILTGDPSEFYTMKIVDLNHKTIKNFARRGNGPNEINAQVCWLSIDNKKNRLLISDNFTYYSYSIDSLKANKNDPIDKFTYNIKENKFIGSTTFCNGFIVGGLFDKKFGLYNIKKKSLIKKLDYPNSGGVLLSQAKFYSHPTKNLVCSFQNKSAVMTILKIENNDLKIKEFSWWTSKGKLIQEVEMQSFILKKGCRAGFLTAAVTNKYIYSLYSGKIINNSSVEMFDKSFLSKYIYVFDWNGKPIMIYELDQEVKSIAVDEKNNILYAASYQGGDPKLIQYHLK
ncbi:BF3164 family lipoprotein [Flavobacterium limnophilum]|uniref:BF3164 family lipoprotein n=1 Tax=Flavobacterium limnophilum TaxID=3003262 RepID=UPI00248294F6|nr:BF3164 family lipoprotein [Flavobacterium limnophilum]